MAYSVINLVGAVSALLAAVFWFRSAYRAPPPMVTYWGSTPPEAPFYRALRFTVLMNRWAAGFSAV